MSMSYFIVYVSELLGIQKYIYNIDEYALLQIILTKEIIRCLINKNILLTDPLTKYLFI